MRTRGVKNTVFLILAATVWVLPAKAQELANIPGAFSESGFGVRPTGMGEAFAALSNDANAFLTNPAGLLLGTRPSFTANYAKLFGIVPSGFFGLQYPMGKLTSIGAGFQFVGDDALMENTAGVSFAFTTRNMQVAGDNEIYFDQMSFGITLKGRWASFGNNPDGGPNRITGSGSGFAVDLGYIYLVNEHLSLGVMVRDLLNRFTWDSSFSGEYTENVPATLRLGAAYEVEGLTLAFDLRKSLHDDTANRAYFGAEKVFLDMLALRAGFSNNLGTSDLNRRWSFGLSLLRGVWENYTVGINSAYQVDGIENLFRFGLDVSWGAHRKNPKPGRVY